MAAVALFTGVSALSAAVTTVITATGVDTSSLQSEVTKQFQTTGAAGFVNAMAAAQAVASNGMGVDYSSNKSIFVVGGGANAGLNVGNNSISDLGNAFKSTAGLPSVGAAVQIGGFVGMSLSKFPMPTIGPIDLKKLTVFLNFGGYTFDQVSPYSIKTSAFGLHAQYKLIEPKSLALGFLNWGGVDVGTGFDIVSNKYSASAGFSEITSGSLKWKPTGTLTIDNSAFVIPIEASTSVRLLYVFSLIGGAGVDIMSSSSTLDISLNGPVSLASTGTTAGTATVSGNEKGSGSAIGVRGFGGLAFNIVPLKNTNVLSVFVIGTAGSVGYGVKAGIQGAF